MEPGNDGMTLIEQKAAFACTVAQEKAPESILFYYRIK